MKNKILALAALGAALYSCKNTITPQEKPVIAKPNTEMVPTPPPTAENVAAGKSLYENNCAKCHNLYDPAKILSRKMGGYPKLDGAKGPARRYPKSSGVCLCKP